MQIFKILLDFLGMLFNFLKIFINFIINLFNYVTYLVSFAIHLPVMYKMFFITTVTLSVILFIFNRKGD